MLQQQQGTTDRLVKIIQTIQLGRGTGVLTARRGQGMSVEEGTIVFVNGQVKEARVGRHTGTEAFNLLSAWGLCLFTFVVETQDGLPLLLPASSPSPTEQEQTQADGQGQSFVPLSPLRRGTRSLAAEAHLPSGNAEPSPTAGTPAAMPYQARPLDVSLQLMAQLGFARAHRQLFLLVNGQRTSAEFARLMGRSQEEIEALLRDLERATVIQFPGKR
jgi:hypothetical protein